MNECVIRANTRFVPTKGFAVLVGVNLVFTLLVFTLPFRIGTSQVHGY